MRSFERASVEPRQCIAGATTTSVTLGELLYGAHRMRELKDALLEKIESLLLPNLAVLPFDADAAHRYGEVRASLEQKGETIGDAIFA